MMKRENESEVKERKGRKMMNVFKRFDLVWFAKSQNRKSRPVTQRFQVECQELDDT